MGPKWKIKTYNPFSDTDGFIQNEKDVTKEDFKTIQGFNDFVGHLQLKLHVDTTKPILI